MFEGKYFLFTLEKGIGVLTLNKSRKSSPKPRESAVWSLRPTENVSPQALT